MALVDLQSFSQGVDKQHCLPAEIAADVLKKNFVQEDAYVSCFKFIIEYIQQ